MAASDPLIGRKLGDYTIQGLLGRGGMSRVYMGYDENLDRYAAVKVISGELVTTDETEYARRFQTEARAIARLRHPSIVGVYQFGRSEGVYYMAQVFLEGTDLRMLLREYAERGQRLPPDKILRITRDIASALDYAHEQGVIHRDIKPSNIMLERRSGRAILMDFGLALSVREGTLGDTFGSAHYIAPEQAVSSAKAVPQSDLYSLGVVVYEMATGTVPFDDPSVMSVALKHVNEDPPAPRLYNPNLPPAVEQVILRALAKDPADRYSTGKEFVEALEQAFGTITPHDEAPATPTPPPGQIAPARRGADTPSRPEPPAPRQADEESRPSGIAARFARRRQQKQEEEALRALEDGTLELTSDDLEALLDSYPDPLDLKLTGPDAEPIQAADVRAAMASASPPAEAITPPRRRSRLRLLLLLTLIVVVAGAAVALSQGNADDASTTASPGNEVIAVDRTPTATRPEATRTQPTRTPRTPTRVVPTVSGGMAIIVTEAEGTMTPRPSATPTASPTATIPPTATASPTRTASPEPTLTPSLTHTPILPGQEPNIRLIYDDDQFILVNISGQVLDITPLIFEQALDDGTTRQFRATTWNREGIVDSPARMRAGGCYQFVTVDASQSQPERRVCPQFLGYFRSSISRRYFWLADEPDAVFTVRTAQDAEPLAVCAIAAGQCDIYTDVVIVPPSPTPTPSATPTDTPTVTPTPTEPDLLLRYNANDVLLVNISPDTLDISGLVFEQTRPDGSVRRFEAAQWNRPDVLAPPTQMEPNTCYQLVTAEGVRTEPDRAVCTRFLGWFRTGVGSRYFWLADEPGAVFVVRDANTGAQLAECMIEAGTCLFRLEADGG